MDGLVVWLTGRMNLFAHGCSDPYIGSGIYCSLGYVTLNVGNMLSCFEGM